MKTKTLLGIRLISTGIAALAYEGMRYGLNETEEIDFESAPIVSRKRITIPLLPIAGALSLLSGIVMLFVGKKEN